MEARKFLLESDYPDPLNLWFQSTDASRSGDGYGLHCQGVISELLMLILQLPQLLVAKHRVLTNQECLTEEPRVFLNPIITLLETVPQRRMWLRLKPKPLR